VCVCVCLCLVPVPMRSQAWAKGRGRMITSGQPRAGDTDKRKQPANPKVCDDRYNRYTAECGVLWERLPLSIRSYTADGKAVSVGEWKDEGRKEC